MSNPTVSVIIPTYNRAHLLLASIASVQRQTYKNFEIIVVDDGSTDATREILAHLIEKGLRYIKHEENLGANAARNTGIRAAHGEFVAFQDSDDTWHPEKLRKQIDACKKLNAQVAFCSFNRLKDNRDQRIPKQRYQIKPGYHDFHSSIMRGCFIGCPTLLISRKLLIEQGMFDENLPRLQDWELCLRLSALTNFYFLDETLVSVKVNSDSISKNYEKYALAADLIMEKHALAFSQDQVASAILYLNVANEAFRIRSFSELLKYTTKSVLLGGIKFPNALLVLMRRR